MLQAIINKAYELFGKYSAIRPLDVCTESCCMAPEREGKLASLPVHDIPMELLREYNDSARTAKTPIDELKHFLPRYMELVATFDFPSHSTPLCFTRLEPFDRTAWTEPELDILNQFAQEFFKICLTCYPLTNGSDSLDDILIMFGKEAFDIQKLLFIWKQAENPESVLHFKDLYFEGVDQHNRRKLKNPFGEEDMSTTLLAWMESEEVKTAFSKQIENVLLGDTDYDETVTYQLNVLYDILRA